MDKEYFDPIQLQSKFIVNSCRVYEFFGFEFRLPFWDKDLVEFFLKLPSEQRLERKFFLQAERQGILIPQLALIPFEDEVNQKPKKETFKRKLKKLIPKSLKSHLVRFFGGKQYEAESLNQIYAMNGKTIGDFLGPLEIYPKDTHDFLRPLFSRPPHRADYHLISGIYAVKLMKIHLKQIK